MKSLYTLFLLFFLSTSTFLFAQSINGVVIDKSSGDPLVGAKISTSNQQRTLSDRDGAFQITTQPADFPLKLIVMMIGYTPDTTTIYALENIRIELWQTEKIMETVVVTASRRNQKIEDLTVSMDVLTPELLESKGFSNLEDAIGQVPGVHTMDEQVSIRGGAGFAYGAGSRVLMLWNGMPLVSADAGDIKFNSIPIEATSQIEVIKGAASVLYGSGALNGIVSLSEREPSTKSTTRVRTQVGVYATPKRASLLWWGTNPTFRSTDIFHGKKHKNIGYTIAVNEASNQGYRQGEIEKRGRVSGTFFFQPEQNRRLKTGIGWNAQWQQRANFIIWEHANKGYQPSGGDAHRNGSTLGYFKGTRINIDPYMKFIDKNNNVHALKTRMYYVNNDNVYAAGQTSTSILSYADYQFLKKMYFGMNITTGLTLTQNDINSNLYKKHNSTNGAFYLQLEQKLFEKLDLTAGVRTEYMEQDGKQGDSHFLINKKDSTSKIPLYPIFRAGLHYALVKTTHIRASYGQGIRYPSVAERHTTTSVGALNIFPNPTLIPEKGWAAELGIKQIVPIGDAWKGMIDIAGFVNQYDNMMEFAFGIFNPDSIPLSINPNDPGYLAKWIGFRADNNESARITGIEASFSSMGTIGEVELTALIGYTYMNPISLNKDSVYLQTLSSYQTDSLGNATWDNTLKYRFNHLFRGDVEATWKMISLGISSRYNSKIVNIDKVFEENILGTYILPGLKEYRANKEPSALVFDARIAYQFLENYRISIIINNFTNREYSARPGDIQAPRNFILQLQAAI